MSDIEITPEMMKAGLARLAASDDLEAWGDRAEVFLADVYRAMAALAPKQATGKAEPPPGYEAGLSKIPIAEE